MTALAWALVALAKVAAPTQIDALHVVASEPALGDEIARAARRYLPRQTQVFSGAAPSPEAAEQHVQLIVQGDPQATRGLRWTLVVSMGPTAKLVRVLELRDPPTRFDLAEAVAIELPELLTRLTEENAAQSQNPPLPAKQPPVRVSTTKSDPVPKRSVPPTVERPIPPSPVPEPSKAPTVVESVPAAKAQATPSVPAPEPAEAKPADSKPADAKPADSKPADAKPADSKSAPTSKSDAANVPTDSPAGAAAEPLATPPQPPPLPPPLPPLETFQPPVPLRPQRPAGAIGLLSGGGAVLLAGVSTGIAALVIAQQVSHPTQMMFDRALDQTGKALGTATIVLDVVGASAILVGGIWMYAKNHRGKPATPTLTLAPAVGPDKQGLVMEGRWP